MGDQPVGNGYLVVSRSVVIGQVTKNSVWYLGEVTKKDHFAMGCRCCGSVFIMLWGVSVSSYNIRWFVVVCSWMGCSSVFVNIERFVCFFEKFGPTFSLKGA